MFEETAPFIEVDHQHGAGPVWARDNCVVDSVEEKLAFPNIGMRVIVVRQSLRFTGEARLDERNLRQRARAARGEKLRGRARDVEILGSPQREKREVAEIIS